MSKLKQTDRLFFKDTGMDPRMVRNIIRNGLNGADDGELFIEHRVDEAVGWTDGRLVANKSSSEQGFGLRFVQGPSVAYAYSNELNEQNIKEAADVVAQMRKQGSTSGKLSFGRHGRVPLQYPFVDLIAEFTKAEKIRLLEKIEHYARSLDSRIKQVSASLSGSVQHVQIMKPDGRRVADVRPLSRLNVSVVLKNGDRQEGGGYGFGGREGYHVLFNEHAWKSAVREAIRVAEIGLQSIDAPAGEMTVVLGSGWPGVMLHEAVGHGLEGDFNRMGTSAFSGRIGQLVASRGVTVIDQGNIPGRRGSLTIDDEGTPTGRTVLIEDGVLVGYIQDRLNARLMGVKSTGNGRREGFNCTPMPRMTNTIMTSGPYDPAEIIESVAKGIYAPGFSGGQVDITSGQFVFEMSEAYLIENGKVTAPVKGATLIGNGPDAMQHIEMVGNDSRLDPGVGTCGKNGQGVPVGVGQPTLKMRSIVGGKGPS